MARPITIHTHEFYPKYGGISTYCHEFATAAARLGHDVRVCAPAGSTSPEAGNDTPTYALQLGAFHSGQDPLNIGRSQAALIRRFQAAPEALHVLAEPGPILGLGLPHRHRPIPPIRLILHGSEVCRWSAPWNPARRVARHALSQAEKIFTVSKAVNDALTAAFPEVSEKASVVYPALPDAFRVRALACCCDDAAAHHHATLEGPLELLSVGRIHPRKGFQDVLAALASLPPEIRSAIRYTIAGAQSDAAYLAKLKKAAKEAGIRVNWHLDPDAATLMALYRKGHVFALTSLPHRRSVEGFGLVYAEAGAFGLPCLAYATGGAGEAVLDGNTGYVLLPGDVGGLANRLILFVNQPEARQAMGAAGRKHWLSQSWKQVVQAVLAPS